MSLRRPKPPIKGGSAPEEKKNKKICGVNGGVNGEVSAPYFHYLC